MRDKIGFVNQQKANCGVRSYGGSEIGMTGYSVSDILAGVDALVDIPPSLVVPLESALLCPGPRHCKVKIFAIS